MSILGQATQPQGAQWAGLLVFVPPAVVSVVVAYLSGAFRRRSIVGPPRVDEGESLGPLLLILVGGFLLWIMVQVVLLAPARPTSAAPGPSTEPAATQVSAEPAATSPSADASPQAKIPPARMAVAATVPALVAGGVMVLANLVMRPSGLRGLGLRRVGRGLFTGLVGSVIVVPLIFLVAQITELLWQAIGYTHPKEHDLLRFMGDSKNIGITVVLVGSAVLVAPLFEELLFRGHLQTLVTHALARLGGGRRAMDLSGGFEIVVPGAGGSLRGGTGSVPEAAISPAPPAGARWASVMLTSLIFAAVHPAWTIPPIFVLSVCLGYAYERTGNLWTVITMHALFNGTSTVLYLAVLR